MSRGAENWKNEISLILPSYNSNPSLQLRASLLAVEGIVQKVRTGASRCQAVLITAAGARELARRTGDRATLHAVCEARRVSEGAEPVE